MLWPWFESTTAIAGSLGSAIWISHLGHLIRHRRKAVFLSDLDATEPFQGDAKADDPGWPNVAVIFAARNEAKGVEAAVRSMLANAEHDPKLRIIAVDDRSSDGTAEILDRLALENPSLEVVHVQELPTGWLGKTNALQLGSETAGADARWLLFTDADVVFQPGAVRRAVAYGEAERVDQVTIAPEVDTRSVGERTFLCLFGLLFSLYAPAGKINDRRSRAHIGVGAFNLIRAEAFRAVGGFRHLALSVDDDMRLGQTLKYAGYSMRVLLGRDSVSVRWQEGTWGMVRGVEKNFFAGLKFQIRRVGVAIVGVIIVGMAPFAGLFVGPMATRVVAGLGVASVMIILAATKRQSRIGMIYAGMMPIASAMILVALTRSVFITLSNKGVTWRNQHYSLGDLKRHVREREAWLEEVWWSTR